MKTAIFGHLVGFFLTHFVAHFGGAVEIVIPDSIVALAGSSTKYYSFHNLVLGEGMIMAVTMKLSASCGGKGFTVRNAGYRIAVGPVEPPVSLDGDVICGMEGVDFQATLKFASTGVDPISVKFRIGSLAGSNRWGGR